MGKGGIRPLSSYSCYLLERVEKRIAEKRRKEQRKIKGGEKEEKDRERCVHREEGEEAEKREREGWRERDT